MSTYSLTYDESWALATLLHLPVQPGSVLANWLNTGEAPAADGLPGTALGGLVAKGYYSMAPSTEPIVAGLLRSLALASVNACDITALIRTNENASLARFAQVGVGILQYGADEEKLSLHDVVQARDFAQTLLPAWFTVGKNENLWGELPLGAFLLFKHACALADWESGVSALETATFSKAKALETFQSSAVWVDVFNAARVKGVPALEQMPLEDYLNLLITRGYLHQADKDILEIGAFGKPLAEALSAPGLCTLTVTLQMWEEKNVSCGVFLHGAERLFMLEFVSGSLAIHQLAGVDSGRFWVENLLGKGALARYAEYSLPLPPDNKPVATKSDAAQQRSGSICVSCGKPLAAAAKFCSSCGATRQVVQVPPAPGKKPPSLAAQCVKCGGRLEPAAKFCPSCGGPVQARPAPATGACPQCGARLSPGAKFCPSCGQKK